MKQLIVIAALALAGCYQTKTFETIDQTIERVEADQGVGRSWVATQTVRTRHHLLGSESSKTSKRTQQLWFCAVPEGGAQPVCVKAAFAKRAPAPRPVPPVTPEAPPALE
jgi:hypothetical protein